METDETFQIEASVNPTDAFFKQILFTTSDPDIIDVTAEGLLTAKNTGKATITVTVEGTEEVIKGVRFRIYGKGLATAGRTATTNKDGLITVTGLYPGETYTIVEEYAKGYEYSTVPVEFRAVWDGNVLVPEIISGSFNKETVIDNKMNKYKTSSQDDFYKNVFRFCRYRTCTGYF